MSDVRRNDKRPSFTPPRERRLKDAVMLGLDTPRKHTTEAVEAA